MEKVFTSFKINFLKNIGEISEQKIELFIKEFNKELPNKTIIPEGVVLNGQINNYIKSLFITPTQIIYSQDGHNIELNFDKPKEIVKKICDKSYVGYKCGVVYNLSCLVDGNGNSNILNNKINLGLNSENIQGVGIKVFLNSENYSGVFYFEPYLKDLTKYFCGLELQLKNQLDINEIVKYAKDELLNLLNEMITKICDNL
jgi:hypothetical protein